MGLPALRCWSALAGLRWARVGLAGFAPCYDHLIHLITESADVLQLSAPIIILLNETDQCIVLIGCES